MFNLVSKYEDSDEALDGDSPFQSVHNNCDYHNIDDFNNYAKHDNNTMSYFHLNCRGLSSNWESFYNLICDLHCETFQLDCIGISELYRCENDKRLTLSGYHEFIYHSLPV